MIAAMVKDAAGVLDRRFLLNAFLPALALGGGLLLVVLQLRTEVSAAVTRFGGQDALLITLETSGFVVAVAVIAGVLSSLEGTIFRLAEGYWRGPMRRTLGVLGRRWHLRRL